MKFAITGANGLIGKALAKRLAEEGHEVIAIYRSDTPLFFDTSPAITIRRGDVLDKEFLEQTFKGVDGVFHVAAFAKPWTKNPALYYQINEQGSINVCQAALKIGVKRVVYTSSAGTHGAQQGDRLVDEETWPTQYHTDYEQSKFNGSKAVLSFQEKGLETTVVSPSRVYAPLDESESNVPRRMMKIYFQRKVGIVPASGKGIGSYVFIDDIVDGHLLAMFKAPSGEEYLLGGHNLNYLDFFEKLAEVSGRNYPVYKIPYQLSLGFGKAQLFAAETIGIKPTITTPWVRKYIKNWGISTQKIEQLGYRVTPAEIGFEKMIEEFLRDR